MISISNPYMTVALSPEGGSLTSIRNAQTGREYLWQGDPAYWTGQAPNLFPFVGRLYEKTYTLHGKAYPMTIHGFVRHAQMEVESQAQSACSFLLTDSPETREIYPYRFAFRIRYALERATLQIVFQVENRSEAPLYCGMGGHPGFQVPLEDGLQFEDYELTFPEPCTPRRVLFSPALQVAPERPLYPLADGCRIPLRHDLFDQDALVLADAPKSVTLSSPKGSHGVTVSYPQMPYVGFWHKP
ncbi:MAG: aldose 1-epimerase family protein [Oscillospiraceae bacterium]